MKMLTVAILSLILTACAAGLAVAGNIDSTGAPSSGSGMYTLSQFYDYVNSGTAATIPGSFQ
ncbi:MAG: hypothetical protein NTZ78_12200 [Candidatus Aureabacteria bacterium]|nr:hypothetical protein [Candidatus Auribacterota bacterium]